MVMEILILTFNNKLLYFIKAQFIYNTKSIVHEIILIVIKR